eukprot:TRINITY_DN2844_c0_g1_i1.p1 TRINITY_DN2844_c0_g1~~TRINITY_DN2844_c0_g1_i1.p1  ORF type:complete len:730 (-),score=173.64 TRINITY_DN2844_c0_g1_i1:36-2225(-)
MRKQVIRLVGGSTRKGRVGCSRGGNRDVRGNNFGINKSRVTINPTLIRAATTLQSIHYSTSTDSNSKPPQTNSSKNPTSQTNPAPNTQPNSGKNPNPQPNPQNTPPNLPKINWDEYRRQHQALQKKPKEDKEETPLIRSNKGYYSALIIIITGLGIATYYMVDWLTPKAPLPPGFVKQRVVVLGTGWAAVSLIQGLDPELYDVTIVSPSNYFVFTPLLSSATIGTVNERSIIEPIRDMCKGQYNYIKGKAKSIDLEKKVVTCVSSASKVVSNTIRTPTTPVREGTQVVTKAEGENLSEEDSVQKVSAQVIDKVVFSLPYDKLVVAIGAKNNTFGTPGVVQHCHFLKSIKDVRQIKEKINSCLELANLPNSTEEFKKKILSFVIVGGGPTGVETAGELKEFLDTTVAQKFPGLAQYGTVTLVQTLDHLLNTFDMKIGKYTEKEFGKRNINVMYKTRAIGVDKEKVIVEKEGVKSELDYGMCIWATGLGVNPFVTLIRDKINQATGTSATPGKEIQKNKNVLITDPWLRVQGVNDVFALGDCASIEHQRLMGHCVELFNAADKDKDGSLTLAEFVAEIEKEKGRFPQLEIIAVKAQQLFREYDKDHNQRLDLAEFKEVLTKIDSQITKLPATAQVASQQGEYLSRIFNAMTRSGGKMENFEAFNYKHLGSFAYIGSDRAVGEFSNKYTVQGIGAWWLWRSVYWSMQYSWKNKVSIAMDWMRTSLFGRDVTL